ncbi:MAG TPA: hypothetical protein VF230_06060 [Acidimicrobiales bacterium]
MKFRYGGVAALAASLLLVSSSANAHHDLQLSVSVSPTTAGAVANTTISSNSGTYLGTTSTTHLPPGALVAHANDSTSPVSPSPQNGDVVGQIVSTSDSWIDGCGNPTNTTATVTWVEPVNSGAPAGTVAQIRGSAQILWTQISKDAYIVHKPNGDSKHAGAHYDIVTPDEPDEYACSGSSASGTTTTYGYAKSGGVTTNRIVSKNPSTVGSHTVHKEYTDTSGNGHSDSASFSTT